MSSSFRTQIPPTTFPFYLSYEDNVLALGSCFVLHLGKKLEVSKFPIQINPFGILYNPASLATALERILEGKAYVEEDLFNYQDLWHSFDHHGSFSATKAQFALEQINTKLETAFQKQGSYTRLFITFGTAHIFWHLEQERIVANCHKLPGKYFERRRLSPEDIITRFQSLFAQLKLINKHLEIILTVSPVRHIRDGFTENQKSKAILLLAIEKLEQQFSFVHYYPAYELILDDLRDYRFYTEDMIHPNGLAIEYIWKHFQDCFFQNSTKGLVQKLEKLHKSVLHRPIHPNTPAHQQFLQQLLEQIGHLETEYAFLDFSNEKQKVQDQLNNI